MSISKEQAFQKGFLLEDSDGDIISEDLSLKERQRYGKGISKVRVYTKNKYKSKLSEMRDHRITFVL